MSVEQRGDAYLRPPQYLDETEALIEVPAYGDLEQENDLLNNFNSIDAEKLGALALLYTNSLRILATARNEDRQLSIRHDGPDFDARAFNTRWSQTLTIQGIARLTESYRAEVRRIARQLSMRHNITSFLKNGQESARLSAYQFAYMQCIASVLQAGSTSIKPPSESNDGFNYFSQGATVIAPNDEDMAILMAHTVKGLGIGKPAEAANRNEQPLRALIIVPSGRRVRQLKGEKGDSAFRRFTPGITIGGYRYGKKEPKADVVVITRNYFEEYFRDGLLNNEESFDIAMHYEDNHMGNLRFPRIFRQHWRGPVIEFSARPGYGRQSNLSTVLGRVIDLGGQLNDNRGLGLDASSTVWSTDIAPGASEIAALTDMTRGDISALAGVDLTTLHHLMTEEELREGQIKLIGPDSSVYRKGYRLMVWSQDDGKRIAERLSLRYQPLPPHLVPITALISVIPLTPSNVYAYLKRTGQPDQRIPLPGVRKAVCYPWEALKIAQNHYHFNLPFKLDYDLLPRDSNDIDPARVAYARGVQYLLVSTEKLGFDAEELRLAKTMAENIKQGLAA